MSYTFKPLAVKIFPENDTFFVFWPHCEMCVYLIPIRGSYCTKYTLRKRPCNYNINLGMNMWFYVSVSQMFSIVHGKWIGQKQVHKIEVITIWP